MRAKLNKTYYFSKEEVLEALCDFVYKKTVEGEYVNPDNYILQFLNDDDKDVEVNMVSIFDLDHK